MTNHRLSVLLLLCVLVGGTVAADRPARTHDITPDDYFGIHWLRELVMSPDGTRVAYTEDRWEGEDDKQNRDLWVVTIDDGAKLRLTFDPARDHSPRWSPDGKYLYFASGVERPGEDKPPYDGETQVWRIPVDGGERQAVTRVDGGIGDFELARDGRHLFYTTEVETIDPEWDELRKEFDTVAYGHGVRDLSELWRLNLEDWNAERVLEADRVVLELDVSPDGRRVAMVTTPDNEIIHREGWSDVDVLDLVSGETSRVTPVGWRGDHASPFGWLDSTAWSDDGGALAFSISFDGYPTRLYVVEWKDGNPDLRELSRDTEVSIVGGSLRWRPGGRDLHFVGEHRARSRVYVIPGVRDGGQGDVAERTPGDVTVGDFNFDRTGDRIVVATSTPTDLPDLYELDGGELRRITRLNPQVDTWKLPRIELVRWKGEGGREVEGVLELPPDWSENDGPLPMIVHIHGGPTASTKYRFRFRSYGRTAFAAKGYAVLSPNYRGSTGYGDDFMVELIGRENDIEVQDILLGVDAMVERGIADPERLGVMGWSNGGFLTNALVAGTTRFRAASSGAGVIEQTMQWGLEDTPGHVVNFMSGHLPWEAPDEYLAGSPLYGVGKTTTPTLIHVGESDARVPAAHARTLYRALHFYRGVPCELVVYPDEPHGLRVKKHQRAKMAWDHAWFDRYLAP